MKKKLQPALIGVFVILSGVLFAIAVIIFGGNSFFERENTVIAFFEDSLQGLSIGAPVTYRGITVGQVKSIKIQINEVTETDHKISVPVLIALTSQDSIIEDVTPNGWKLTPDQFLQSMCKQGLRAKLKTQSLVTGKRYIDLAIYKNDIPVYHSTSGEYLEIPTIPSEIHQFQQVMEKVNFAHLYEKISNTLSNLEEISTNLATSLTREKSKEMVADASSALAKLDSILSRVDGQIKPILNKIDSSLNDINNLTASADRTVDDFNIQLTPLMKNLDTSIKSLDETMQLADVFLKSANDVLTPDSPFYFRLTETLQQLENAGRSVQTLGDFLYRNPDSLILGLQQTGETDHE